MAVEMKKSVDLSGLPGEAIDDPRARQSSIRSNRIGSCHSRACGISEPPRVVSL